MQMKLFSTTSWKYCPTVAQLNTKRSDIQKIFTKRSHKHLPQIYPRPENQVILPKSSTHTPPPLQVMMMMMTPPLFGHNFLFWLFPIFFAAYKFSIIIFLQLTVSQNSLKDYELFKHYEWLASNFSQQYHSWIKQRIKEMVTWEGVFWWANKFSLSAP